MTRDPMRPFRGLLHATIISLLALAAVLIGVGVCYGQGEIDDWCIQRAWCNGPSHTVLTVGSATLIGETTPLEIDEARWIPVGFYVGKEIRDRIKWGDDLGWGDTAMDLGFVALGWWVSGHVNDWMHDD